MTKQIAIDLQRHLSKELQEATLRHVQRAAGVVDSAALLSMHVRGGLDLISSGICSVVLTFADGKPVERKLVDEMVEAAARDLIGRADAIFAKASGDLAPGDRTIVVEA